MHRVTRFLRAVVKKVSNFMMGTIIVVGRLIGVKRVSATKYATMQLVTAGWVFFLGIPIGLAVFGSQFPVTAWAVIILTFLAVANLDDALILTASFAEYGVYGEVPNN